MKNNVKQNLKFTTGLWHELVHLIESLMSFACPIIGLIIGLVTHVKILTILSIVGIVINLILVAISFVAASYIKETSYDYDNVCACFGDCIKTFYEG